MSSNPDLDARPALARRVRLQIDRVSSEPVLLYPEGLLILNETAHAIVRRCDGLTSVEDLVNQLAEEYGATHEDLLPDVLGCLRDLQQRQLMAY